MFLMYFGLDLKLLSSEINEIRYMINKSLACNLHNLLCELTKSTRKQSAEVFGAKGLFFNIS